MVINMKWKATKLRRLINSQANVSTIGDALVDFYVPDIHVYQTLRRGSSYYEHDPEREAGRAISISWAINDGLTGLLHEIGHAVLHHTLDEGRDGLPALFEEVEAWLWAERSAVRFTLGFNYPFADNCFKGHLECNEKPGDCIIINWAHR